MVNWLSIDYGYDKMDAYPAPGPERCDQGCQRRGPAVLGGLRGRQEVPPQVIARRRGALVWKYRLLGSHRLSRRLATNPSSPSMWLRSSASVRVSLGIR